MASQSSCDLFGGRDSLANGEEHGKCEEKATHPRLISDVDWDLFVVVKGRPLNVDKLKCKSGKLLSKGSPRECKTK